MMRCFRPNGLEFGISDCPIRLALSSRVEQSFPPDIIQQTKTLGHMYWIYGSIPFTSHMEEYHIEGTLLNAADGKKPLPPWMVETLKIMR